MNVCECLRRMRTEANATRVQVTGGLEEFSAVPSWTLRAIVLFSLWTLGLGLFTYLLALASK